MIFNPLEYPICLEFPLWLEETAWAEHIPFAMFLAAALHPRVLVELGAYRGVSYCAFCQAVKSLPTETKCYAIDTWQGDAHAGLLEEGVLMKLQAHHDPLYGGFSRLVQSTFDEALNHFAENSIDLLHIDGFHTYEAVKHDFQTWLPKMSERGIVLFHDTNVRERDFGVWKFWTELKEKYPHFEFLHGHGLGVLAVGAEIPNELKFLYEADEAETKLIRSFFYQLGSRINAVQKLHDQQNQIKSLQTYERVVQNSRMLRIYLILKEEGFGSLVKEGANKFGENK
ncbi:MAG: class I SAM-dependent methyltransferase [Pyrinomonadaceae bacterium]|nr:class I SAM-dependent methyltransferase [Pyrinomonadaceae bacterium]